jgi:hypothetical protein
VITWTLVIWFCTLSGCTQTHPHNLASMTAAECVTTRASFMNRVGNVLTESPTSESVSWPESRCMPSNEVTP